MELAFLGVPIIGDFLISGKSYVVPLFPALDNMVLDSSGLPTSIRKYYCKSGTNVVDANGALIPPILELESLGKIYS